MQISKASSKPKKDNRWLYHIRQWHWISSAISLAGLLLFAVTGVTLNHADLIKGTPTVTQWEKTLPADLPLLTLEQKQQKQLPSAWQNWLSNETHYNLAHYLQEWEEDEVYISLPSAGSDAWLSIALDTKTVTFEERHRGTVAVLNDLHKGRNTGTAWRWFIDIFAVACIVFSITGLFLLIYYQKQRKTTWAYVSTGFIVPLVLILLFVHI